MTRPRRRFAAIPERSIALAVSLWLGASAAHAQRNEENTEQGRRLFQQGLEALDRGRLVEAAQHFERSYRLRPSAVVLVNLALVFRSQGRYLDAQIAFRRAIDEGARELLPDELARARNDLARLELAIPVVTLEGLVEGASVQCDGRAIDGAGPTRAVRLDPGAHVFNITADGYEPEQRAVRLEPSDAQVIPLQLRRSPRARLWISLPRDAQDARVLVDGAPWTQIEGPQTVGSGSHRVRVLAAGYAPFDRTVTVFERTTVRVDVSLTRAAPRVAPWAIALATTAATVAVGAAVAVPIAVANTPEPLPTGLWDGPISTPAGMAR